MDLHQIRKQIDNIDDSILELFAKRFDLCKEISSYKEKNNLSLKDNNRELEIIKERTTKFSELGHNEPEFVEDIFTLILDKSRQKIRYCQHKEGEPKIISIIGGRGKMGSLFAEEFRKRGHTVLVSNEEKTNSIELAQKGNLVIVTVPIHKVGEVLKEVIPHLKEDALLTDFTSIKEEPLEIMKNSGSSFVGGHPLFGQVKSLDDKNFILTPGRGSFSWYQELLQSIGLNVIVMPAQEHDKAMAVVQCLTHFSNMAFANLLKKMEIKENISTPAYKSRLKKIKRMFSQDASLISEIQFRNKFSEKMAADYLQSVTELQQIVSSGSKDKFESLFNEAKEALK